MKAEYLIYFPPVKKLPYILIDLSATIVTNRQMLMGVLRYAHLHGPWLTQIIGYDAHLSAQNALNSRQYDGAIIDVENSSIARQILKLGIPVVQTISDIATPPPFADGNAIRATVTSDNRGIGRAAADFLLSRGFQNFSALGIASAWSQNRLLSFAERLKSRGCEAQTYELPVMRRGKRELARLRKWLLALPKPTALFIVNDPLARQANNVALQAGIAMPEELSILSVDNDPVFCESTTPPVSSIRMNTEECGFNAARALDRMMNGQREEGPIIYGYAGVEERMSTNVSCYKDPLVAATVRTMTDRIICGKQPSISAGELAQAMKTSLRLLEVRFKSETGRTLHEEIARLRFEQAQKLLKSTALSINEIAYRCGFATASHFSVMFKRTLGSTPLAYRKS